ncbi:MAG: quinone-dependent dihydroorotate dehydrogenase [Leptospiraceae bacterium]|nr:quinone-dependent dihydroorotate dehydrogenase [Leptospiraceae bacterium]MCP5499139.1 quinone-dependent dihydroorotate dehydrogenase [Leptospiraceae bacterium]
MLRDQLYKKLIKPFFFRKDPETAHYSMLKSLKTLSGVPFFIKLLSKSCTYKSERLHTELKGLHFSNPLGLAAGFDKTGELYPYLSRLGFGFIEVGTITGEKQDGNPLPRIFRYEEEFALINRMGFNNPGSEEAFHILNTQKKVIPRGINAGKTKVVALENALEDYLKTFKRLIPLSDYAVINISSPNTPGLRNLQEKDSFYKLIQGIQKGLSESFQIPIFVKFAPDLNDKDIEELLEIVQSLNLGGVILTNTTINEKVLHTNRLIESGGISGKPLRQRSNETIRLAYKKLQGKTPIIGVGGIFSGEDALEKIQLGANLIQIYTGYVYEGPFLPYKILSYLDSFMMKQGVRSIEELVGTASNL